jgi:hypothetical protein
MVGEPLVLEGVCRHQRKQSCGVFGDLFFAKKPTKEEK